MKKESAFSQAVFAIVLLTPLVLQAKAPLAVLLSCRGDVVVSKGGGEAVKGVFGLPLNPGDEVKTGGGSEAEILFEDGNLVRIGEGSSMQVKGTMGEKPADRTALGGKTFETVQSFLKLKDSEGTSSLARLRSAQRRPEILAVSPCRTRVRGTRPTFRWKISDPSTELLLTVYDEEGVRWQEKVERGATSLSYPEGAPPLVSGKTYSWTLETTDPLRFPPLRSQAAFFEILSSGEEGELEASLDRISREKKPSGSTYHLMRASLFFGHSLLEDAIAETLKALEIDSENTTLHAILAHLYAEVGRVEEAMGEYDRLLENR